MTLRRRDHSQKGVALLVVILLVATLSFIAVAISQRTTLSANRSLNANLRSELIWRALGAEAMAVKAIKAAMSATPGKLTSTNPLVVKPIEIPMPGGSAVVRVLDQTRCFNLNSLYSTGKQEGEGQKAGLVQGALDELADTLNAGQTNTVAAAKLAADVVDWIDTNSFQEPGGAEDGHYTGLPTPYRTGGQRLADVSELRAMAGMDRIQYSEARPYLCAQPSSDPSPINVNMLLPPDAPLLVGLLKGAISASDALDIIEARPPGGYDSVDQFWANPRLVNLDIGQAERAHVRVYSRYLEVIAEIDYQGANLDLRMTFVVSEDGDAQLLSRRIGRFE